MPSNERPITLMLVCGEPSGDQLGAQLMARVKQIADENVQFIGLGGAAMAAQGLKSLFPLDATAVMGLREVVPRIPEILRRVRLAADYAVSHRPDAVVCIDSPDFTHRIAQRLRRINSGIATVNYVAPQVWASRQYRARKMSRYFDLVLALLPFEASFFEAHGLRASFVGHPVVERAAQMVGGPQLRKRLGISLDAPVVAVLPGSRMSEIRPLLPIFRDTIARVQEQIPELVCVLPVVPHLAPVIRNIAEHWLTPLHIVENESDKFSAFDAADVALAASGTVTTELALAGTPMVVAYRIGWLTAVLMRPLIRVRYVSLVNLLLEREAVPELLQHRCRADLLAPALLRLLQDTEAREQQKQYLAKAVRLLGRDEEAPSLRAARAMLEFVREWRASQRRSSGR